MLKLLVFHRPNDWLGWVRRVIELSGVVIRIAVGQTVDSPGLLCGDGWVVKALGWAVS